MWRDLLTTGKYLLGAFLWKAGTNTSSSCLTNLVTICCLVWIQPILHNCKRWQLGYSFSASLDWPRLYVHCFCVFSRSTGQTVKRQTDNLHVDYYVTRDFKLEFKGSALQQIEKNVEEDYVSNVRNNCWKERQTSEWPQLYHTLRTSSLNTRWFALFLSLPLSFRSAHCFFFLSFPETDLLYAAKVYRDDRMRKKAELMTMDNCRELDRLNNLFRGGWVGPF